MGSTTTTTTTKTTTTTTTNTSTTTTTTTGTTTSSAASAVGFVTLVSSWNDRETLCLDANRATDGLTTGILRSAFDAVPGVSIAKEQFTSVLCSSETRKLQASVRHL